MHALHVSMVASLYECPLLHPVWTRYSMKVYLIPKYMSIGPFLGEGTVQYVPFEVTNPFT